MTRKPAEAAVPSHVAFLRAIGPATHKAMPLAKLVKAAEAEGLHTVSSYIASGNILFAARQDEAKLARLFGTLIAGFGLDLDVFIRDAASMPGIIAANPFPDAAQARPNHLLVIMFAETLTAADAAILAQHGGPERLQIAGREIFVDYLEGVGTSKIQPGIIERRLKRRGTARNWNTLLKINALLNRPAVI